MAGNVEVDLIVKAISEGFEKVADDLKKAGDGAGGAGDESEKASHKFTELANQLNVAKDAAKIFFGTFEKVFELGKAGEQINQTTASFEGLVESIGAAPDLLDQLRSASKGTVDDMKLMSSTLTLAAGASDELAGAMMGAAPQLMEIAKAANKLNPTLGDTTFMYESLAMGIKRSSPLILDNLGLTIKVEEANRQYADSIGKTVDQLTAEELKMALLEATLKAGDQMLQQVGGSTDSATDSIARMETATKNAADAFKAMLAPAISDAADAIYYMLEGADLIGEALRKHASSVASSAKNWDEYSAEMIRAAKAAGLFAKEVDGEIKVFERQGNTFIEVTDSLNLLNESMFRNRSESSEATRAADKMTATNIQLAKTAADAAKSNTGMANSMHLSKDAMEDALDAMNGADEALQSLAKAQDELTATTEALAAGLAGELQDALDDYSETMGELIEEHTRLTDELAEAERLYGANSEKVAELTGALKENEEEQLKAGEALRVATAEMIYQQAAAGLDAGAALELARSMGILSESDYATAMMVQLLRQEFDLNRDGMISAEEAARGYNSSILLMQQAIAKLQSTGTEITFENLKKAMEELAKAAGSEDAQNAGEAAKDVAEGVEDAGKASEDAEGSMEDAATSMDKLAGAADDAKDPVDDLADTIARLPKSVNVRFSQSGGDAVLKLLKDIKAGIADLPSYKKVVIEVEAKEGPPQNIQGNENLSGGNQNAGGPTTIVNNEFNVYDQMAGELLLEQQRMAARGMAEELMNGR
ncbi:MAG: hypothetical protein C4575_12960 [Desulforudis sp.]|jgi:methyl-accepting chemotaxis protein|nr:MAG: hypothetical protein C4575_12960 [Desulforudis sp.]